MDLEILVELFIKDAMPATTDPATLLRTFVAFIVETDNGAALEEPCDCSCHGWNNGPDKVQWCDLGGGDAENGPRPCIVACCDCWPVDDPTSPWRASTKERR